MAEGKRAGADHIEQGLLTGPRFPAGVPSGARWAYARGFFFFAFFEKVSRCNQTPRVCALFGCKEAIHDQRKPMTAAFEQLESRTLMSAAPTISAAQKQNLQKLATDLKTIHANSSVTTTEITALESAIAAVAAVAVKTQFNGGHQVHHRS